MATTQGQRADPGKESSERANPEHGVHSVAEVGTGVQPHVIPRNQLVVLRERDLECDLETAVRRVRPDAATRDSRILIVAPEPAETPPPGLPLPNPPTSIAQVARRGGELALVDAGARLAPKLESLRCLMSELRHGLDDLDDAALDGARATLARRVSGVRDVVQWLDANVADLESTVAHQGLGFAPVDVYDLCGELRGQVESFFPEIRINVAAPDAEATAWARGSDLAEGLFLGLVLTAHRIGGAGSVNLQFSRRESHLVLRIVGLGEPVQVDAPKQTRRFRDLIVGLHRGRVVPDSMGPFGTGYVLELPIGPEESPFGLVIQILRTDTDSRGQVKPKKVSQNRRVTIAARRPMGLVDTLLWFRTRFDDHRFPWYPAQDVLRASQGSLGGNR